MTFSKALIVGVILVLAPLFGTGSGTGVAVAGSTARLDRTGSNGLNLTVNLIESGVDFVHVYLGGETRFAVSSVVGPVSPYRGQLCFAIAFGVNCTPGQDANGVLHVQFTTSPQYPDESLTDLVMGYPDGQTEYLQFCAPGTNRIVYDAVVPKGGTPPPRQGTSCGQAKVQSVTFKATPVVADRPGQGTPPLTVSQEPAGGCDAPSVSADWVDCPQPDGTPERVWPVIVPRSAPLTIAEARFGAKYFAPGSHPVVQGDVDLGNGTTMHLGPASGTAENASSSGTGTLVFKNVSTDAPLPPSVGLLHVTITWKVRSGDGDTVSAGSSTHPLYVVLGDPVYDIPQAPQQNYLTTVDISSTAAQGRSSEADVVKAVWDAFKTLHLQTRTLDTATGTVSPSSAVLSYWTPWTLKQYVTNTYPQICPGVRGPLPLLQEGVGRCGLWADFFTAALNVQGIHAEAVDVQHQPGFPCGPVCDFRRESMMVKDWTFRGKGTGSQVWPYQDIIRLGGGSPYHMVKNEFSYPQQTKGQGGVTSPPGLFAVGDHEVVKYGGKIYDPSYGTGPYGNIRHWAKASLAGYMEYAGQKTKHGLVYVLRAHRGICDTPCH